MLHLLLFLGGVTLHRAFSFKFGNKKCKLEPKNLAKMRDYLDHLKVLIIDEISFVGADMLYRIHYRLKEIFQTPDNVLFGGLDVILVGDLLQLPPVQSSMVFKKPKSVKLAAAFDVLKIWERFQPIILKENHRQKDEKEWADCLNRFRVGVVTEPDVARLRKRVTTEEFLDQNSLHVFYKNKDVTNHNKRMLETLPGPLYQSKAFHTLPKGKTEYINPSKGTTGSTEFLDILDMKIGARCVLNYNLDMIDDLFNGATGKIVGIEFNNKGNMECIIVRFDDENCGIHLRSKHPTLAKKYEESRGTPIYRFELDYQLQTRRFKSGEKAKVLQFPLKINYAQTAHKMQVLFFKPFLY